MDENGTTNVTSAGECEEIFVRESSSPELTKQRRRRPRLRQPRGNDFVPFSATPLLPRLHFHAIRRCTDRVGRTKVKVLVSIPPPATRGTDFLTQTHPPQQSYWPSSLTFFRWNMYFNRSIFGLPTLLTAVRTTSARNRSTILSSVECGGRRWSSEADLSSLRWRQAADMAAF